MTESEAAPGKEDPQQHESTAESEYIAVTEVTKEIIFLRNVLQELQLLPTGPTKIYEDNKACILMANDNMVSARNKHFGMKQQFIREKIKKQIIQLIKIGTNKQRADLFTKNLCRPRFEYLRKLILSPDENHSEEKL